MPKYYWENINELNSLLPTHKIFKSLGSIDRYGFSHLLAKQCGLDKPPRTFAEWLHGWVWDDKPNPESLAVQKLRRNLQLIVRSEAERNALIEAGFKNIAIGGLPFMYVNQQHKFRNPYSLLAFPPHSAEAERLNSNQEDYLDYLESIKNSFDGIYVSIFYLDWDGSMHFEAKKRGLHVIQGSRPDDINSLIRMRAIFDSFSFVTSNTMGSHFMYALFAGCKFTFSGPWYYYDEDVLLANGNPHGYSSHAIRRSIEVQQFEYLKSRFENFFANSPSEGSFGQNLAAEEMGQRYRLSLHEITHLLGWTWLGQIQGYVGGGMRKIGASFC